jgi:peptidoglycan/xylan/chitin deacetylase (PgdA/CDA1 family)
MLSRVVAVDSTNGAVYAGQKADDPASSPLVLNSKEIVLTFDQGPHPSNTKYILDILDHHCVKATFFFAGSAALANPSSVRDVSQRGHTLAAGPSPASADFGEIGFEAAKMEVEKGLTAVAKASNAPAAPFFRVAATNVAPDVLAYLKERGVSLWSIDLAAGDEEPGLTATKLANRTLAKIQQAGKGVIQFHDTKKVTVDALDSILYNLKLGGFRVVHIVPATSFTPKDEYLTGLAEPAILAAAPSRVSHTLVESAKRRVRDSEAGVRRVRRYRRPSLREQSSGAMAPLAERRRARVEQ